MAAGTVFTYTDCMPTSPAGRVLPMPKPGREGAVVHMTPTCRTMSKSPRDIIQSVVF